MQQVPFPGFDGGLVLNTDPSSLEPNELAEATNVRIGNRGEVQRRTGYSHWGANLGRHIHYIHRWATKLGVDNTLIVDDVGDLEVVRHESIHFKVEGNVGYGVPGDPITYPLSFAAGEDFLYISSLRKDHVQRWDGTTLVEVTKTHQNTDADDKDKDGNPTTYVLMPAGQHIAYRHGRMYVGHTKKESSRIWFSHVLEPERFGQESWVDLDPEDGTGITAMLNYADELFIFKDNSIWEMTGRDPTTYSLRTVDKLRGTVSPKTVCQMRGLLVFFDRDTGLWGYDGSQLTLLSEKINEHLLQGQDYGLASLANAYFGDDRLYLSLPWAKEGEEGWRTFVMNAENGAWSEYTTGFYVGDYYRQNRYQAHTTILGLQVANARTDEIAGNEYESWFRTGWVFPTGGGRKNRLRRVELVVEANQGSEIEVQLHRDMQKVFPHVTRTFQTVYNEYDTPGDSSTHSRSDHIITLDGWGSRFHAMQLRVGMKYIPTEVVSMVAFVTGGEDVYGERR